MHSVYLRHEDNSQGMEKQNNRLKNTVPGTLNMYTTGSMREVVFLDIFSPFSSSLLIMMHVNTTVSSPHYWDQQGTATGTKLPLLNRLVLSSPSSPPDLITFLNAPHQQQLRFEFLDSSFATWRRVNTRIFNAPCRGLKIRTRTSNVVECGIPAKYLTVAITGNK